MSSQTFTFFPALPSELRQQIWLFTLPGPRKIVPFTAYTTGLFHEHNKGPKDHLPLTLHINRESRAIALKHYKNWHNAAALGYQYVDFNVDTVCFLNPDFYDRSHMPRYSPGIQAALLKLSKADLWKIRRLEITFSGIRTTFPNELKAWIEKWLMALFPGVKELHVVWAWGFAMDEAYRGGGRDPDLIAKIVKGDVDAAMEVVRATLEEIERKSGSGWKAPVLRIDTTEWAVEWRVGY
jgi:hypothetical protein